MDSYYIQLFFVFRRECMKVRYVNKITHNLSIFNNYHDCLKLTVEFEKDRSINFIGLTLITLKVNNNNHKETFIEKILLYYFNYPHCHKILTEQFCCPTINSNKQTSNYV